MKLLRNIGLVLCLLTLGAGLIIADDCEDAYEECVKAFADRDDACGDDYEIAMVEAEIASLQKQLELINGCFSETQKEREKRDDCYENDYENFWRCAADCMLRENELALALENDLNEEQAKLDKREGELYEALGECYQASKDAYEECCDQVEASDACDEEIVGE